MQYFGLVSNYGIFIHPSTWEGPEPPKLRQTRQVFIYNMALASGGSGFAWLNFIPAGRRVPDSRMRAGSTDPVTWDLYLPMDDYTAIVDLLRNEQPIAFNFDDTAPNGWFMGTAGEIPGEDQGK
jgi:hypothetical protein